MACVDISPTTHGPDSVLVASSQNSVKPGRSHHHRPLFVACCPPLAVCVVPVARQAKYGSIDNYLDSIGFDADWRERLRGALLS